MRELVNPTNVGFILSKSNWEKKQQHLWIKWKSLQFSFFLRQPPMPSEKNIWGTYKLKMVYQRASYTLQSDAIVFLAKKNRQAKLTETKRLPPDLYPLVNQWDWVSLTLLHPADSRNRSRFLATRFLWIVWLAQNVLCSHEQRCQISNHLLHWDKWEC